MSSTVSAKPQIVTVGPRPDGSGLELGVSNIDSSTTEQEVSDAVPELVTDIDWTVVPTVRPEPAWRGDDTPPHRGGSAISRIAGTNIYDCSSAFPMRRPVITLTPPFETWEYGMTTAAHCGSGQWTSYFGQPQGTTANIQNDRDIQVYRVASSSTEIWLGSYFDDLSTQAPRDINGVAYNYVGDYVCASGAWSGSLCNVQINATHQTVSYAGFGTVFEVVRADHTKGYAIAGNGDSGGPIFHLDPYAVWARGIISGMPGRSSTYTRSCRGAPTEPAPGRYCSYRTYFTGAPTMSGSGWRVHY